MEKWKKVELAPTDGIYVSTYEKNDNMQNTLVCEYDFPTAMYVKNNKSDPEKDDTCYSVYLDRIADKILMRHGFRYDKMTEKELFELANKLSGETVTGLRLVWFTNVSSGYPCPRLDCFTKSPDTPKLIEKAKRHIQLNDYEVIE